MNRLNKRMRGLLNTELSRRVFRAVAFGVGGSVLSRVFMMLANMLASRILGKSLYGQFSLINSTVLTFITFSSVGINSTITRYVTLNRDNQKTVGKSIGSLGTLSIGLSIVISVALFFSAEYISLWVAESKELVSYFQLTSLAVLFAALASVLQGILVGLERFKDNARVQVYGNMVFLAGVLLLSSSFGVVGAILSLVLCYFYQLVHYLLINIRLLAQLGITIQVRLDEELVRILGSYTLPSYLAGISVTPAIWYTNSLLTKTAGYANFAVFSIAHTWMHILVFIPSQLGQMKPIYTDLYKQGKHRELFSMLNKTTLVSSLVIVPFVLFGILFSDWILLLYGIRDPLGNTVFTLMLVTSIVINSQSQIGFLFQAIGKMWLGFLVNIVWVFVFILSYHLMIDKGSEGLALAYLISYANHTLLSYVVLMMIRMRSKQ